MNVDLSTIGCVPFQYAELASLLSNYSAPKNKVQDMERKGEIVRLKKGLFVAGQCYMGLIANHLHGPSYVSQRTALRHYGLIPEKVIAIKSITMSRSVEYENSVGRFVYTHVSDDYYPIGITLREDSGVWFQIATPEKALCDTIVSTFGLNLRSMSTLLEYLEEDLRFDTDVLKDMNAGIVEACATVGKKRHTLLNLSKLIRR